MKQLVERVLPKGRGNHSNGEKRSQAAKMGRGVDAFSAKITLDQKAITERIEAIASRNPVMGMISVSYPLHVRRETIKAVKF